MASRIARSARENNSSPSSSSESSRAASISASRRLSISSLAPTCAQMSPTVWSGVRTLARIISIRVSSARPSRMSFINGMCSPSSNTSRASIARKRPPMSGMCEVVAENATRRPARKIGLRTLTSLMCPVPIHASLVMSTSPGRIAAGPIARRK